MNFARIEKRMHELKNTPVSTEENAAALEKLTAFLETGSLPAIDAVSEKQRNFASDRRAAYIGRHMEDIKKLHEKASAGALSRYDMDQYIPFLIVATYTSAREIIDITNTAF